VSSVSVPNEKRVFTGRRGDPSKAPRCGARTRRGTPCKLPAEKNPKTGLRKRCRLHGGLSTGPVTSEGRRRIIEARTIHGRYSKAAKEARRQLRQRLAELKTKRKGN
jgi:hypothetical protein